MKKLLAVSIIFLFFAMITFPSTGIQIQNNPVIKSYGGNTLYVGGNGSGNYSNIQAAIENASDGDTVFVYNGTYYENVVIDESINLVGEDRNNTVIDGNNITFTVHMTADNINLYEFTIKNSDLYTGTSAGIWIESNHNTIFNNIIKNNKHGVFIFSHKIATENNIYNNIIERNKYSGIRLFFDSMGNKIFQNNITNNKDSGIELSFSTNNEIFNNNISYNEKSGIYINLDSGFNIINENKINSNTDNGIQITNSDNNTISYNNIINNKWRGIIIEGDNNSINFNKINSNNMGIDIKFSLNNKIEDNKISNNSFGILFKDCNYSIIKNNNIFNNKQFGIQIFIDCFNNEIKGNDIKNNVNGILLAELTDNNIICHNNFIDNNETAYDIGENNSWDDGKYGNYWCDYEEKYPDAKPKIFKPWMWDSPYEIYKGNKDNCPLIKPWSKSKLKDIPNNKSISGSLLLSFLERYPLLNLLLQRLTRL